MATQKLYTQEFIDRLIEQMDALPPYQRTDRSKQELIAELAPVITSLREKKGYTWEAVAQVVTNMGVPISAAVLRTYLRRAKKQQQPRSQEQRRGHRRRRPS